MGPRPTPQPCAKFPGCEPRPAAGQEAAQGNLLFVEKGAAFLIPF